MEPVPATLTVGALVVVGNWARGQVPTINHAIGVAGVAIFLSLLAQANGKMASAFAWLIILSMAIIHVPTIVKNTVGTK